MSAEVRTERKTFWHYLTKQPKPDIRSQLCELVANEMLKTMLHSMTLFNVSLSIPVGTASAGRSFSQMKMIITLFCIGETRLSQLLE